MIDQLHLQNLKAWRDSGPVQLAPVTMLLGANSSGKSTLLQSLLLLKQTVASPDRTVHLNLGGDEANDYFHFGDFDAVLSRGVAAPRQFSIELSFQRPEGERVRHGRFACSYGQTASGAVAIQELQLSTVARRFRAVRRERGAYAVYVDDESRPRGKGLQLAPERSIALPAEALALLGTDGTHLQDLSLALRRELEGIVYLGPLRRRPDRDYVWNKTTPGEVGSDGHKAIDALLANFLLPSEHQGSVLRSVSHWLQRMGMAEQLSVRALGRSGRYEVLVHHDGVVANLRDVGVGVSQVLPVLAVAYCAPPGSTVLLEEPEIHLHPLAQAVLAEMFAEVSQQRQVQFLVETHSEHLFRRMQTLIARRQASTAQCRMLFVERQGADAVLVPLDVDEFGAVRNWPPRFFGDAMGEAREQARARAQRLRETAVG
jgi:predicted ATPase